MPSDFTSPREKPPSVPDMSQSTRSLLSQVRRIVPPLLSHFHKGQLGRVAVLGGSADYTGAPYFSAMASARLGCDMSYVFCEPSAAPTIKGYSPNLMVSPILRSTASLKQEGRSEDESAEDLAKPVLAMLARLHVLVIGPGLGRDEITQRQVKGVIQAARKLDKPLPMVLDADALWLVQNNPDLVKECKDVILTPNVVEFGRLAKALGVDQNKGKKEEVCKRLSQALGGVCIIQKGGVDYISNGEETVVGDLTGGLKRAGGQGDTLTGSLGTFLAWREAYHEGLWDEEVNRQRTGTEEKLSRRQTLLLAAFAGSSITRECSRRAFIKHGRALQASDLTEEVHGSFLDLIGEPEGDWASVLEGGPPGKSNL